MNVTVAKLRKISWYDYLLIPLFLVYFHRGILSLWVTFTSREFYENGIAFVLISALFVFLTVRNKHHLHISSGNKTVPCMLLLLVLIIDTLNALFFKFSIVPAILFLLGVYCLLGLYLESRFWKRSLFIFLILILTLPILERAQKFLGFPIRLITAHMVSYLLQFFGIGNVSQSAVIVTENHATSIDLPCSGVKSIYTGALFMFAVYYLQKVRISWKLLGISLLFFGVLLFFNAWRVFSLVYIYDVLDMKSFGNTVHVFLGVMGFIISCSLLWIATNRFVSKGLLNKQAPDGQHASTIYFTQITIVLLSLLIMVHWFLVKSQSVTYTPQNTRSYALKNIKLVELPFSDSEQSYFVNSDVELSKKFSGVTASGQSFSLLVVASKSARTHHDPEICLQGLGYEINNSEILQVNDLRMRKLSLNNNQDEVLYWYVGRDKNLLDYSERVWEEVTNPNQTWVLVILGFRNPIDISREDISTLLHEINVSSQLLIQ